jgi:hypothetical protein
MSTKGRKAIMSSEGGAGASKKDAAGGKGASTSKGVLGGSGIDQLSSSQKTNEMDIDGEQKSGEPEETQVTAAKLARRNIKFTNTSTANKLTRSGSTTASGIRDSNGN